jgi:hypothetical protein
MTEKKRGGNPAKLVSFNDRTIEEQREIAIKGGKASGKVRKEKRTFQKLTQMMLDMKAPSILADKLKQMFPDLDPKKIDYRVAGIAMQIQNMLKGDLSSFVELRKTAGETPVNEIEIGQQINNITLEFVNVKNEQNIEYTENKQFNYDKNNIDAMVTFVQPTDTKEKDEV